MASPLLTLAEARALLHEEARPRTPILLPASEAFGARLAEPVVAAFDHPRVDISAMDGYAARAADLVPGDALPVAFEIAAGASPGLLPEGAAARIFTGAALPAGADTVVPQEQAARAGSRVTLAAFERGTHVRRRAELFREGETVLASGTRLTPTALALAVMAGAESVRVVPRPALAVLATGNELRSSERAPSSEPIQGPSEGALLADSNSPMLRALAVEAGLPVASAQHARDELEPLVAALEAAVARAPLVVSTGGVSVGDHDLVPRAVAALSGRTIFHGVSCRPGKPILLAKIGTAWLAALPGNPVAALVGWRLFVRPLAERLAGDAEAFAETPWPCEVTTPVANDGPRTALHPCRLEHTGEGRLLASPTGFAGSHDVFGMARANGLLVIEPHRRLAPREAAAVYPLPWVWPLQ